MSLEKPSSEALRTEIEQKRRESFKGSGTYSYLEGLSPAALLEPTVVAEICRNASNWALEYRGYKDEDSFYELVTQLSEKLGEYAAANTDNAVGGEELASEVTRIIDETFPTVEQPVE